MQTTRRSKRQFSCISRFVERQYFPMKTFMPKSYYEKKCCIIYRVSLGHGDLRMGKQSVYISLSKNNGHVFENFIYQLNHLITRKRREVKMALVEISAKAQNKLIKDFNGLHVVIQEVLQRSIGWFMESRVTRVLNIFILWSELFRKYDNNSTRN